MFECGGIVLRSSKVWNFLRMFWETGWLFVEKHMKVAPRFASAFRLKADEMFSNSVSEKQIDVLWVFLLFSEVFYPEKITKNCVRRPVNQF